MKKRALAILLCVIMAVSVLPVSALAVDTSEVTITKTDINADGVFNTGGYGSLKTNYHYNYNETDDTYEESMQKAALIDRNGSFVFPYKDTWHRYYYDDGVVSLVGDAYEQNILGYEVEETETGENVYKSIKDEIGFWDLDGTPLFSCEDYWGAWRMREGYAFVTSIEKKGEDNETVFMSYLIDRNGEKAFSFATEIMYSGGGDYGIVYDVFDKATAFSDGLLLCWSYSREAWFNNYRLITSSLCYKDVTGKTVLTLSPDKYSNARIFSNGYAMVRSADTGLVGYIDKSGKEVIPCVYKDGKDFNDGLTAVQLNDKWGYINDKNEVVIPCEYDGAYGAADGLAAVGKAGKYGLVDYNNNVIVPLEYDDISSYDEGVAYAIKGGELYIITGFGGPTYKKGDVNRDGDVTNSDLIMVARYVVSLTTFDDEQKKIGDMDDDGDIGNTDIITIARMIVGLA